MRKSLLTIGAALLGTASMMGQKVYETQHYGTMRADTIYSVTIGPGTTETRATVNFSTTGVSGDPFNAAATVNYLEIDLNNPYVTLKVARAGNTIDDVKKSVKNIMAENTTYRNHYFAGVNGDFFGYTTCGYTVADGKFINAGDGMSNQAATNQLVIDKDGVPTIATEIAIGGAKDPGWMVHEGPTMGIVTYPNGVSDQSLRMNAFRWEGYQIAYNDAYKDLRVAESPGQQGYTNTNQWGSEAILYPTYGNVNMIGEEVEYLVNSITHSGTPGNNKIPAKGLVLSGTNCSKAEHPFYAVDGKMKTLVPGDKVKIKFPFTADGVEMTCRETVGGYPRLVVEGKAISAAPSGAPSDLALTTRRARTAVGYNADKTKMYIFVVQDNRDANGSRADGITAKALANLMQAVGCYEALNLDGGGSSVLHVENLGQRSDVQGSWSYQRPVMNGLFAVTTAPEDREVASIEFVDKHVTIQPGRGYQPVIYAYNKYGVLISSQLQNYTLSATEGTATFTSGNRKMIAPAEGKYALTASYNGITATIPVYVDAEGIEGSDPEAEATFSGNEFTAIPAKPADWVDPDQPNLYIVGKANNWNFNDPIVVNPVVGKNNIYEFDLNVADKTNADATYFKMTTLDPRTNGGSAAFKAEGHPWHINNTAGMANAEILGNGVTLGLLPGNDNNIQCPWNGNWHFVVDLNEKTITATTDTKRSDLAAPTALTLVTEGESNGETFIEKESGVYVLALADFSNSESPVFNLKDGNGKLYGPYINGIAVDQSNVFYASDNSWSVKPAAYAITVNFNNGEVSLREEYANPIYAKLTDVTPAGYDFDKYNPGDRLKFAELPSTTTSGTWTAPAGIYYNDDMDDYGHVTALHFAGNALDNQDRSKVITGFSIQAHPNPLVGNCLVYAANWSPGMSTYKWPNATSDAYTKQLSFYADPRTVKGTDAEHPIRFRMVFQLHFRGRHEAANPGKYGNEISNIYASVSNANSAWVPNHNGIGDNTVGSQFPVDHKMFWRWENEGETIADMPIEKEIKTVSNVAEPWDGGFTTNPYLINGERFMVYEFDFYRGANTNNVAVHVNIKADQPWLSIAIKEVKFFNVENGAEILTQPRAQGPARVANAENAFVSNTVYGSLLNTRSISYRYYTEEGIKEFDYPSTGDSSAIDAINTDDNAPVEYYNLQGIKVNNPNAGVYIKRQGSRTTKVLVK